MQLKMALAALALLIGTHANAQEATSMEDAAERDTSKINLEAIDMTFVTSYYQQDGNHSPVTGGRGTEYLTNLAPGVVLNIPMDTLRNLSVSAGIDFYSSASSDNINNPFLVNHVTGASGKDERWYGTVAYKKKNADKTTSKGFSIGVSSEWDVQSVQLGLNWAKESKDHNRELNAKASYYFDSWKLIYPLELRNGSTELLPTKVRQSINLSVTGSAVINKRMQAAITTDFVMQSGLLSTPFHRVYFAGQENATIEQLPDNRIKVPLGFRFHYNINDLLMLRTHYRFYNDSWGIMGNTVKVELPIKISRGFRLYPFYRYHQQTAADYFADYKVHTGTEAFYTSDYDLSALTSQKFGLGMWISPLYGFGRWKSLARRGKVDMLKAIDLRYAYYTRSDGLNANVVTLGLDFQLGK